MATTEVINERAVAVAKEVILLVDTLDMCRGAYIELDLPEGIFTEKPTGDLQNYVGVIAPHCTTCMLGACILAKAKLFDEVDAEILFGTREQSNKCAGNFAVNMDDVDPALGDVFSDEQLALIETAFECRPIRTGWQSDVRGAVIFGMRHDDPHARAKAVAQNIIDHGGVFVVAPLTVEEMRKAEARWGDPNDALFEDRDSNEEFDDEEDDVDESDDDDDLDDDFEV